MGEQALELVTTPRDFDEVVEALLASEVYAIDTEFLRERTYFPVLALVQVAWPEGVALLDPLELDMSRLRPVLESDEKLALVHAGSQDIPILNAAVGAVPSRIFDTQIAAAFLGHGVASLANLVERELGRRLQKGSQLTDWTKRPLDARARKYAAADVLHLHDLYGVTRRRLEERGRLQWVREECEALRTRELQPRSLDEAWWRLKGKSKLRGSARGVAQALARFRLEEAARRDVPVKRVLSDMAILGMAGRPPQRTKDLERIRGLGNLGRGFANKVLEAVSLGESLPDSELSLPPKRPKGDDIRAASSLAVAWVQQLSQDHDIEPAMLATRDDVESFLRGQPCRLDHGWRNELTSSLRAIRDGKAALGVRQGRLVLVDVDL